MAGQAKVHLHAALCCLNGLAEPWPWPTLGQLNPWGSYRISFVSLIFQTPRCGFPRRIGMVRQQTHSQNSGTELSSLRTNTKGFAGRYPFSLLF